MSLIVPKGIGSGERFPISDIPHESITMFSVLLGNKDMLDGFSNSQHTHGHIGVLRPKIDELYGPDITTMFFGGWCIFNSIQGLETGNPPNIDLRTTLEIVTSPPGEMEGFIGESMSKLLVELPFACEVIKDVSGRYHPGDVQSCMGGAAVARELVVAGIFKDFENEFI